MLDAADTGDPGADLSHRSRTKGQTTMPRVVPPLSLMPMATHSHPAARMGNRNRRLCQLLHRHPQLRLRRHPPIAPTPTPQPTAIPTAAPAPTPDRQPEPATTPTPAAKALPTATFAPTAAPSPSVVAPTPEQAFGEQEDTDLPVWAWLVIGIAALATVAAGAYALNGNGGGRNR